MNLLKKLSMAALPLCLLCACRIFTPASFFEENYTLWPYVQPAPAHFTEDDLHKLGIAHDMKFTEPQTQAKVYVFRRHHTPWYSGPPDKQYAEVWKFCPKTGKTLGVYLYRYAKNI